MVVPNIKNVASLSIIQIAAEMERLRVKALDGSLQPVDLQGGTITLSNIGNIGGTLLHPVLVSSQVCIGAIGKSRRVPMYDIVDGVEIIAPKTVVDISFNADHRVIDGATMARFVQTWKGYLEKPDTLAATLK